MMIQPDLNNEADYFDSNQEAIDYFNSLLNKEVYIFDVVEGTYSKDTVVDWYEYFPNDFSDDFDNDGRYNGDIPFYILTENKKSAMIAARNTMHGAIYKIDWFIIFLTEEEAKNKAKSYVIKDILE